MAAAGDLEVRFQRVESKIDALGVSVDEMSADHRAHTTFAVERLATELRARFDSVDARFERVDAKFDAMEARFDSADARLGTVLARLDGTDTRLERMDVRFTRLERKVDRILEHLLPGAVPDTRSRQ